MSQRTTEEYLETIGALEEREQPVSTSAIAQSMGVSLASVSEMLRRLAEKGFVEHQPYGGASLTAEGRKHFLHLTRRHRLWEVFLNRHLGVPWEDVYQHACSLEHATTDLVADRLAEFLDNPAYCPHGSPIPGKDLKHASDPGRTLSDIEPGKTVVISNIILERDPDFLRYLTGLGLTPGAPVKVVEKAAYDGTLTVEVAGAVKAVGKEAASLVLVRPDASARK
jgi:DtxR family Mn-dependent transcriptional regulator